MSGEGVDILVDDIQNNTNFRNDTLLYIHGYTSTIILKLCQSKMRKVKLHV